MLETVTIYLFWHVKMAVLLCLCVRKGEKEELAKCELAITRHPPCIAFMMIVYDHWLVNKRIANFDWWLLSDQSAIQEANSSGQRNNFSNKQRITIEDYFVYYWSLATQQQVRLDVEGYSVIIYRHVLVAIFHANTIGILVLLLSKAGSVAVANCFGVVVVKQHERSKMSLLLYESLVCIIDYFEILGQCMDH